jgi:hypothetical protein
MARKVDNEQRVIVLRYDPRRRNFVLLTALVIAIVLLLAGFLGGRHLATHERTAALQKKEELERQLASSTARLAELAQQVANFKLGAEIDREAANQVREEIKALRGGISSLEEEIAFYRRLMAPGAEKKGLDIHSLELYRRTMADPIRYKIVMQQLGARHPVIKGTVNIDVIGQREGQKIVIPLPQMTEELTEENIKLRFRYFQNIEGELILPEGFQPSRVRIVARSSGRDGQEIEKLFDWIVKEV